MPRQSRGDGHRRAAPKDGDRRIGRRALLIGGAVAAVATGVLARDELGRMWWRMPGMAKPRKEGEVDYTGARWVAASSANWRMADRPDDYAVDRVIIHVTQGSFNSAVKVFQDPGHGAAAGACIVRKDGHVTQMIRELDVAFPRGQPGVQRAERRHRARGLRGEARGLHGRDVRGLGAADGEGLRAVRHTRRPGAHHRAVPGTDHTDPGEGWDWEKYLRLVAQAGTASAASEQEST